MKKLVLMLLALSLALLCGCTGYREIERGYLVTAIGISADNGNFTITLEAISSFDVVDKPSEVITLSDSGKSIGEAYAGLENQLAKPLYFEQLGTIITDSTLTDTQLQAAVAFYQTLPSVNLGIYLVKTDDVSALFNNQTSSGVLGYDIIGIIKSFEKRNNINLSNRLYEINRNGFAKGFDNAPSINIINQKVQLDLADGGYYE